MRSLFAAIQNMFGRFAAWAWKRAGAFSLTALIFGGVMLVGDFAWAAEGTVGGTVANYLAQFVSAVFNIVGWLASQVLVNAVIPVLIKAMSFNNFVNAAPVVAGWVVVRDFTNLLFIVVLLVIAFGIIFGADKYGRVDMIPQLFIMAVAINFSRTIVGFLADISMVFMLTFTRAFEQAAAGNFVDLFSVDVSKSLNADSIAQVADAAAAITVANIVSALMLVITTIILGYLAVMMMVRIVVIWILIVLAPLAWFSKVVESWGVHLWDDWWKELKAQLTVGPIMAFFIWLALATASGAGADFVNNVGPDGSRIDAAATVGFLDGATVQNIVKAIIATVILMKGLEIAQHAGGTGNMLGAAGKKATGFAKGLLGAGTVGFGGAVTRLGMRTLGGTKDSGAGEFRQKLTAYGNSQSATGLMLADVGRATSRGLGGMAAKAQSVPVLGRAVPGLLQRKGVELGASIAAVGTGMVESAEKGVKGEVPTDPALIGTSLKQLMSIPKEARSSAQSIQLKELIKAAEGNAKVWKELEPKDVSELFKHREQETAKIGDATARREALHHDEEFFAKNIHRLPADEQAAAIEHLPGEFKGKISLEAITVDSNKVKTPEGADTEATRVQKNIDALATDPDKFAIMATKNEGAFISALKYGKPEAIARMAQTNKIDKNDVTTTVAKSVPADQLVTLFGNLPSTTRKGIRDNEELSIIIREKISEAKAADAAREVPTRELSPDKPGASKTSFVANLELHTGNLAKRGSGVDMTQTLGIANGGTYTSGDARDNFERIVLGVGGKKDTKLAAEAMLNLPPERIEGELAESLSKHLDRGVLLEIQKQLNAPNSTLDDEQVRALFGKLSTLKTPDGEMRLYEQMKGNKTLADYVDKSVEPKRASAGQRQATAASAPRAPIGFAIPSAPPVSKDKGNRS